MKAIILAAGQGSRLLPLTEDCPKCLLELAPGRTIIEDQIEKLAACGVDEVVALTGFRTAAVEAKLAEMARPGLAARALFNPFYNVADNLGSCWMARGEMAGPFILLNGDTLFEAAVAEKLIAEARDDITLTINRKAEYDADDMKVVLEGGRLAEVGKRLRHERIDGESIGMTLFKGGGPALFAETLDQFMRGPTGIKFWYLKAIDALAGRGLVDTISIEGLAWGEVDFPEDLERAQALFGAA